MGRGKGGAEVIGGSACWPSFCRWFPLVVPGTVLALWRARLRARGRFEVRPFLNQTLQPRLTDAVALELRKVFQRDGTYRLATRDDGDVVLTGTITTYNTLELSFNPSDVLTARDYRLLVVAQVRAYDRRNGKELWNLPFTGITEARVGTDFTSSERQALPLLAESLAKSVKSRLTEGAW